MVPQADPTSAAGRVRGPGRHEGEPTPGGPKAPPRSPVARGVPRMDGEGPKLARELNIWEAIGISVALMAPSMAANINPQGMVGVVGRAIPLTFALATVGVLLVAYTFVRLTQRFNHSGSVYGFVGATLGPRAGVVAGWCLLGTYTFYGVVTSTAASRFVLAFLDGTGLWKSPPDALVLVLVPLVLLGIFWLTISPIRLGTRFLLIVEGAT